MTAAVAPDRSARPSRRPVAAGSPAPLHVVTKETSARRARRRRTRVTLGLSACVVTGALLAVAGGGAVVVSGQLRLDSVRAQVAATLAQDQSLQVQRAMLESPSRIISIAEQRLGMVPPATIHYLYPHP